MKIAYCEQASKEWFELKAGKIGGTRFGQVISDRKNRLVYDLLNETLMGYCEPDDYISDDMLFGTENEPIARDLYSKESGIEFEQVGCILSDHSDIHLASPDGINQDRGIVLEIKCTQNGAIHLQRFFEGPESDKMPQIINYFAVSDEVKEVHWVSYCPDRTERPLFAKIFRRTDLIKHGRGTATIEEVARIGISQIGETQTELNQKQREFVF